MENEDHVTMELQALLDKQPLIQTKRCSIYKVPDQIRETNVKAYIPTVVSIGPLHHGDPRLQKMEDHKLLYYKHFIQRSNASLSELVSCVRWLEPQISACYSEKIDLTVDEFLKVILVDSAFIIEFLFEDEWTKGDIIFSQQWLRNQINSDLILLENQLPFFVLEKIYNLAFASMLPNGGHEFPSFTLLDFAFAFSVSFTFTINKILKPPPHDSSILHFTDMFRYLLLKQQPSGRKDASLALGRCASELAEAGVKFIVNKSSSSMLDLEFKNGTLTIPPIQVEDGTEIWLRNVVALEQCHYPKQHYITDYVRFLGHLMNTNKDAGVLIKAGIIDCIVGGGNYESSVAKLFNDVRKNILVTDTNVDFLQICNDLNGYYKNPWHRMMATLRGDYFATPWKAAGSIAAIVLLILTVIQTVCSILQVK
ncbi:hypothetical protein PIB30_069283 [Stylosanthes scabra]|uniref:Uncharacterized protein n=1 Tax=Stylosanthes scabra TaxID=79078 RepID=A0ABU6XPH6_9FABA|nr:hypothetical protein [Stylosanthes scabra]